MINLEETYTYFISYCSEDVKKEDLDYIIWLFKKATPNYVKPLVFTDLKVGNDIQAFMEKLKNETAVIVLLGPEYAKRIITRKGGVYKEWSIIMDRLEKTEEARRNGMELEGNPNFLEVLPLLYSGEMSNSVPNEISSKVYGDIRNLRTKKNIKGKFIVTQNNQKKYYPLIKDLSDQIRKSWETKLGRGNRESQELFDLFFVDLKAGWKELTADQKHYLNTVFVRTFAFENIDTQSSIFIVGRKGSGKSTITDIVAIRNKERLKGIIPITGEMLNLEAVFSLFDPNQIKSDIKVLFKRSKAFRYGWEVFLRICCIDIITQLSEKGRLTEHQKNHAPILQCWLKEINNHQDSAESDRLKTYFTYAFGRIPSFLDECIKKARPVNEHFYSDVEAFLTRDNFRNYAIPENVQKSAASIFETCRRHFLISLDGFDRAFDDFRKSSEDRQSTIAMQERALFEIEWLSAFLSEVLDIHLDKSNNSLYRLIDFCIAIPQDRFFEILAHERDCYQYRNKYRWLNWSGIELTILLRKRLEQLTGMSAEKFSEKKKKETRSPEERLENIQRVKYPQIPWIVKFTFNERIYKMPLFLYVLRYTFWRPRDILYYYSRLIGNVEGKTKQGYNISTATLRKIIFDATYNVLRDEYLTEFQPALNNISEIVNLFKGKKQVMPYAEVDGTLRDTKFMVALSSTCAGKTEDKIRFLYKTGFLGIYVDKGLREKFNIETPHAFFFNEGTIPLNIIQSSPDNNLRLIIHPVFEGYLALDTTGNELIFNYEWNYLHNLESSLFKTGDGFLW